MADHSAETFARLDAMAKELKTVEARNQKLTTIEHPLFINGEPYADLWIPSYHQMMMELGNYDTDDVCEAMIHGGVGEMWSCTQPSGHRGLSHVACYTDIERETRRDQMLEIWNDADTKVLSRQTLWVYDSTGKREPELHRVNLPDITAVARRLAGRPSCAEEETFTGRGYICTLPEFHVYSHVAANTDRTLAFWPKSD